MSDEQHACQKSQRRPCPRMDTAYYVPRFDGERSFIADAIFGVWLCSKHAAPYLAAGECAPPAQPGAADVGGTDG